MMDLCESQGGRQMLADGEHVFSAAQLHSRVREDADWISKHEVARCAILADNGLPWIVADLALMAANSIAIPLPTYFTATQVRHVLTNIGADSILTDTPPADGSSLSEFVVAGTAPGSDLTLLIRRKTSPQPPLPAGTCKVSYTSGSTGDPKGVCLGRQGMLDVARSLAGLSAELQVERHLCLLPLPTLLENIAGVYAPLLAGIACSVPSLVRTGMNYGQLDVARLLGSITDHQPHSLILVPELLRVLVTAAERGWTPPDSLRFVAVGGATVPAALLDRARRIALPVHEGYGLTECSSVVSLNRPGATRDGSVGRPLPHATVRVDDSGEIHVRGSLFLGYVGDRSSPAEFATGDLGEFDADGYLYVRGRRKNVIVTSLGRNLSPEWIESLLVAQPMIGQALIGGEGRTHPFALLVPADPRVPEADLQAAVRAANAQLPDYAQVHEWIRIDSPFTAAEGLLTANGRPKRSEILAKYACALRARPPAPLPFNHAPH